METTTKSDAVREALRSVAEANGGVLRPVDVVEAARDITSPLHSRFTWDDGEAADKYRLWEARQLIRVTVDVIDGAKDSVRMCVSLRDDRARAGGGYRMTRVVLEDPEMRAAMVREALADMKVFREKHKALVELAAVFAAMESAEARLTG